MSLSVTSITPKIRKKVLSSKYIRKDFKDILRERLRNRIRQNRKSFIEKLRGTGNSIQDTISDYLISEINELNESNCKSEIIGTDNCIATTYSVNDSCEKNYFSNIDDRELESMRIIQEELINEQVQWLLEQYSTEESIIQDMIIDLTACPICIRGILKKSFKEDPITCTICSLRLPSSVSLEELSVKIRENFDEHSLICNYNAEFIVIYENYLGMLCIICKHCHLFKSLN